MTEYNLTCMYEKQVYRFIVHGVYIISPFKSQVVNTNIKGACKIPEAICINTWITNFTKGVEEHRGLLLLKKSLRNIYWNVTEQILTLV